MGFYFYFYFFLPFKFVLYFSNFSDDEFINEEEFALLEAKIDSLQKEKPQFLDQNQRFIHLTPIIYPILKPIKSDLALKKLIGSLLLEKKVILSILQMIFKK